ncbi:MAG: LysE family translocator [Tidjanibacter sp.]|nr:LysE family translocator [Tidjanibacter sp.]
MWLMTFIGGVMVGCMASMPPGPTAILTIQRNVSKGWFSGISTGLGIATSDTFYASIAFFSLSFVTGFIESNMLLIKCIAGICIAAFGVNIFLKKPDMQLRRNKAQGDHLNWKDYASGFLLSFANPAYILVHIALIATVKSMGFYDTDENAFANASMILGIFTGCAGWWIGLSSLLKMIRKYFRPRHLLWINRISGIVITLIGVSLLISMISDLQIDIHFNEFSKLFKTK